MLGKGGILPRKNKHIWNNWSAVPRMRILVDRRGYSNSQVLEYLVRRFGKQEKSNTRDLQFQISHLKNSCKGPEQIWKCLLLQRKIALEFPSGTKISQGSRSWTSQSRRVARERVRGAIKSRNRFLVRDFELSELEVPEGYSIKWVWGKSGTFQAYCPPYGEQKSSPYFDLSVAA